MADRVDKRRFLMVTQTLAGLLALALGVLVVDRHRSQLWMVFALALAVGMVNAFDMPARQTFVFEMVGPDLLTNAVTLNSVVMNGARIVGPAIAGVLIATVGLAPCFIDQRRQLPRLHRRPGPDAPGRARPRSSPDPGRRASSARASATSGPTRPCARRCC